MDPDLDPKHCSEKYVDGNFVVVCLNTLLYTKRNSLGKMPRCNTIILFVGVAELGRERGRFTD
jgi:hypothetical protein